MLLDRAMSCHVLSNYAFPDPMQVDEQPEGKRARLLSRSPRGVSKTWGSLLPLSGISQADQPKAGK